MSFWLDGRRHDHLAPTLAVLPDEFRGFRRGTSNRRNKEFFKPLPPAVVRLRLHSPSIEVRVVEAMPNASLPRVRDGSVDFALGPLLQRPAPPDLVTTPLIAIDIAIVVRHGHPLAKARTLAALVDQDWITAGLGRDTALVDGMFREAGLLPPRWAVRCESITGLIAMVARSDLIATIAKPLSNLVFAGDVLEVVKVRERLATSSVCLFAKRDSPLTPSATLLAKYIRDAARQLRTAATANS
jgi:DNA-binding transcriptional LysR family regulator